MPAGRPLEPTGDGRPRWMAATSRFGRYRTRRTGRLVRRTSAEVVVIPRKGQPGPTRRAAEHRPSFRELVKWRTGCEGRIAHLKRRSGWDRTMLDRASCADKVVDGL